MNDTMIHLSNQFIYLGLEDDDIEIELEAGAQDCCLIEFDYSYETDMNLFPLNKPISDQTQQNQEIFRIIKNMYVDAQAPQHRPSQVLYPYFIFSFFCDQ